MSKAAELANLIGNINAGGGGVNRNVVINGAMNVAQRGTSSTSVGASSGFFTCDRWAIDPSGTAGRLTMTQDSSAPEGFANSIKLDCTTADTSIAAGEVLILQQRIEGQNLQTFAKGTSSAKPFAFSFYVKGNASATYVAEIYDNDNGRQISKTFSVTTDWTRVELTFPADTTGAFDDDNAVSVYLNIWLHGGSNFTSGTLSTTWSSVTQANRAVGISSFFDSTDRTFFITGVQLEVGQNPTSFEHEPFERTLAKCQRYTFLVDNAPLKGTASEAALAARLGLLYPVEMRATPTVTITQTGGTSHFQVFDGSISKTFQSTQSSYNTNKLCEFDFVTESGLTVGNGCTTYQDSGRSSEFKFDAEL